MNSHWRAENSRRLRGTEGSLNFRPGRGGRVVECSGLENRRTRKGSVSSNLTHAADDAKLHRDCTQWFNSPGRDLHASLPADIRRSIWRHRSGPFTPAPAALACRSGRTAGAYVGVVAWTSSVRSTQHLGAAPDPGYTENGLNRSSLKEKASWLTSVRSV